MSALLTGKAPERVIWRDDVRELIRDAEDDNDHYAVMHVQLAAICGPGEAELYQGMARSINDLAQEHISAGYLTPAIEHKRSAVEAIIRLMAVEAGVAKPVEAL